MTRKTTAKTPRSGDTPPIATPIATRPPTVATADGVHTAALEAMAVGLDAIHEQIAAIRTGRVVPSRRDPGSVIASLSARAGVLFEATRKAKAARAKELSAISPALVLAWYRQLDRTERDRILSELHAVDSRRSGLA